jgi:hypothetical protein
MNRLRAVFGTSLKKAPVAVSVATGMYNGLNLDKPTYNNPNPSLPVFLTLITNVSTAQQAVRTRVVGAAEARNVQLSFLVSAMETERTFIQSLADASPAHASTLIRNAGLAIAATSVYTKGLLTLRAGRESGSIICDANVGLLVGVGVAHPSQNRFFNWEYTLDGGKTFVTMPSTTKGKTLLQNLVPLTLVGVRVNLNIGSGPGPWSPVVTIPVH